MHGRVGEIARLGLWPDMRAAIFGRAKVPSCTPHSHSPCGCRMSDAGRRCSQARNCKLRVLDSDSFSRHPASDILISVRLSTVARVRRSGVPARSDTWDSGGPHCSGRSGRRTCLVRRALAGRVRRWRRVRDAGQHSRMMSSSESSEEGHSAVTLGGAARISAKTAVARRISSIVPRPMRAW